MSSIGRVTRFGLRNFKAFHYLEDIELKPLTVLVGANSAGKSSIFQALLLLKQSSEAGPSAGPLKFTGEWTKLGGFANVVSDFDVLRPIEFRFGIEVPPPPGLLTRALFPHLKGGADENGGIASDVSCYSPAAQILRRRS